MVNRHEYLINKRKLTLTDPLRGSVPTDGKQNERMSIMESCNGKDIYRCLSENNKTKRKENQKGKATYCPDAQEKEDVVRQY
jgi:hypothetical protein